MWRRIKLAKETEGDSALVTIGNGQIHFGISACRLMPECLKMTHVEFYRCEQDYLIGVNMVDTPSIDAVPIQRPLSTSKKAKNKPVQSFKVVSMRAISRVFGDLGAAPESVKCKVYVDPDSHHMFVIDVRDPKQAKKRGVEYAKD